MNVLRAGRFCPPLRRSTTEERLPPKHYKPFSSRLRYKRCRSGFTLIEILVALLIITLISGILIVAVSSALRYFRGVAAAQSINEIVKALEIYKQQYSEYPPDGTDVDAVERHIKKRWPKYTQSPSDLAALIGRVPQGDMAVGALTFWLCGDPNDPPLFDGIYEPTPEQRNPKVQYFDSVNSVDVVFPFSILCNEKENPIIYFRGGSNGYTMPPIVFNREDGVDGQRSILPYAAFNRDTYQLISVADKPVKPTDPDKNMTNFSNGKTMNDFLEK